MNYLKARAIEYFYFKSEIIIVELISCSVFC